MATHNRAGLIRRAAESVLAQEDVSLELVIVDDGSSDDTPSVLSELSADPRVKVMTHTRNRGLPASLNDGIANGRGKLVARIDDDDVWTAPDKLARQVRAFKAHPQLGLLGTAYVDEGGQVASNPQEDAAIRAQLLFRCPFCHSSIVMRRDAYELAGRYDESLPYAEDWDLWLRIGRNWKLGNLDDVCVVRHRGEATLSERYFHRQLDMATAFARRYAGDYPRPGLARIYHRVSQLFFRLAPVGGVLHRGLQGAFETVFRLRR